MTARRTEPRWATSIAELRELRLSERAPESLRARVLDRLDRERVLAVPSRAQRRLGSWRLEPVSLTLGAVAASLFGAWLYSTRDVGPPSPEIALAPEPAGTPTNAGRARAARGPAPPAPDSLGASTAVEPLAQRGRAARAPVAKQLAASTPALRGSSIGEPAPQTQPGLYRDQPARDMVVPGFAPTARAVVHDAPLPRALGPNLVTNGDFAQGAALWSVHRWDDFLSSAPTMPAPYDVVQGALCTTIRGGDFVVGGWPWQDRSLSPSSFWLERGQRYRLSLRAWVKGALPVALVIKVAHQWEPYGPAVVASVPVTQVPHVFSVAFEPHEDDDDAGIAFVANALANRPSLLGSSDLCIDDVKLTREARPL